MLDRRTVLALIATQVLSTAATAAETPEAFITGIYRQLAAGKGDRGGQFIWLDPTNRKRYFSASIVALWRKAEAATPEGDALIDFDPMTNSQDPDVKSFKVTAENVTPTKASFAVKITSRQFQRAHAEDAVIRYDLVLERGRWWIDDIRGGSGDNKWSLREMLTFALKPN
jgi:hypothetical protein